MRSGAFARSGQRARYCYFRNLSTSMPSRPIQRHTTAHLRSKARATAAKLPSWLSSSASSSAFPGRGRRDGRLSSSSSSPRVARRSCTRAGRSARRSSGFPSDELARLVRQFPTDVLGAMAAHAQAAVALAEGYPEDALVPLRGSLRVWQRAGAPYIVARQRVLLARACRLLGDEDTAGRELGLARDAFQRLGAAPDLAALEEERTRPASAVPLSAREVEVLRLVASGKTNKVIAKLLFLSEKTIHRHVSNIFHKTNSRSRAAATAYAYEKGLVGHAS